MGLIESDLDNRIRKIIYRQHLGSIRTEETSPRVTSVDRVMLGCDVEHFRATKFCLLELCRSGVNNNADEGSSPRVLLVHSMGKGVPNPL